MDFKIVDSNQKKPNMPDIPEPKLDVKAIPDLEKLLGTILDFLNYINTDEMQKLENSDQISYERHLESKFEDFSLRYYGIFKLLLDKENREDNLAKLIDIFSKLKEVKLGKVDIYKATEDYQEELSHEYVYPKFGGKEQFRKKMLDGKNIKKNNK